MMSTLSRYLRRVAVKQARLETGRPIGRYRLKNFQVQYSRYCHTQSQSTGGVLKNYVNKVLDNPLPIGVGALVVGILQWKRIRDRGRAQLEEPGTVQESEDDHEHDDWTVTVYKSLPLRHVSRFWGYINNIYLPPLVRRQVLGGYARLFGCNLSEAEVENLDHYENLGMFFKRRLKASARNISGEDLISPCDGKVLHYGPIPLDGHVEKVKGLRYSLKYFLGSHFASSDEAVPPVHVVSQVDFRPEQLGQLENVPKKLYQCVFYLAPGDYHCFHSPVDWTVKLRRHFPGELLSVNPSIVKKINKLFEINERAVYIGEWKHGFFSLAAVGATNVGSIKVGLDPELETNKWKWESKTFHQKHFKDGQAVAKGELFGEFNLGSTIVLIFEAPEDFQFDLFPGKTIKVGNAIGPQTVLQQSSNTGFNLHEFSISQSRN